MARAGQLVGALANEVTSFEAMAGLGSFEERKKALLKKCDHAFKVAEVGRNYVDKKGETHSNPDAGGMVRCIELAARILGVLAEAERAAKNGDGDTRSIDVERVAEMLRDAGYTVERQAA